MSLYISCQYIPPLESSLRIMATNMLVCPTTRKKYLQALSMNASYDVYKFKSLSHVVPFPCVHYECFLMELVTICSPFLCQLQSDSKNCKFDEFLRRKKNFVTSIIPSHVPVIPLGCSKSCKELKYLVFI